MAYDITLEGKNLIIAERMLENVAKLLNESDIQYWLEGGTLLGIRREDRLLPWDNDVDVSMMIDQQPKLDLLYSLLKKSGFRVRTRRFKSSSQYFKKGDLRMIKIRERRFFGSLKGSVCLDIFIKYPKDNNCYWKISNKTKFVPIKFYSAFKTISFKGIDYAIPELTDEYLSYRYGDWQTPQKDWNTHTDDKAIA